MIEEDNTTFISYSTIKNGVITRVVEIRPFFKFSHRSDFLMYDDVFDYVQRRANYAASSYFGWLTCQEIYIHPKCKNRLEYLQLARIKNVKIIIKIKG